MRLKGKWANVMKNVEFNLPIKQWQLGFTSICILERLLWCLCRGLELSREGEQVFEGKQLTGEVDKSW